MNLAGLSQIDIAVYGGIGSLLPVLVALINRPHFPAWVKQLIMIGLAVVAGVITYGLKNGWDFTSSTGLVTALLGVWAATQAAYLLFWGKALAPTIEANVNGGQQPQDVAPDASDAIDENGPDDGEAGSEASGTPAATTA